ncbi:hypothetical protein AAVH_31788 [Aphelenchoides avenae]|nr:hypothetical protein AAVH_31788 [Aphelenchus avenae]
MRFLLVTSPTPLFFVNNGKTSSNCSRTRPSAAPDAAYDSPAVEGLYSKCFKDSIKRKQDPRRPVLPGNRFISRMFLHSGSVIFVRVLVGSLGG